MTLNPALSTATYCKGGQAFCGSAVMTHGGLPVQAAYKKNFSTPQNWAGKTVTAWTYFSAGFDLVSAQIYIKSNAGVYSNGPITHPPPAGGWAVVSFDLTQPAVYIAGVTNTASVDEVGLQLYSNATDPDGSLTFCIDEFAAQ